MGSYCACALPGPCQRSRSLAQTKRIVGSGDENENGCENKKNSSILRFVSKRKSLWRVKRRLSWLYWKRFFGLALLVYFKVERKFPRSTTNQKRYQDLGSARHQYGISALVTQTSFCEDSGADLAKRRLFFRLTFMMRLRSDEQETFFPTVIVSSW